MSFSGNALSGSFSVTFAFPLLNLLWISSSVSGSISSISGDFCLFSFWFNDYQLLSSSISLIHYFSFFISLKTADQVNQDPPIANQEQLEHPAIDQGQQEQPPQEQPPQEQNEDVILLSFDKKHNICANVDQDFWDTAEYVEVEKHIRATINQTPITIDVEVIRRVLRFDDTDDNPSEFDSTGDAALREQPAAVDAALATAVAAQLERKRKGKGVATCEPFKKKCVSAGAGVIIGVPSPRQTTTQRPIVPVTTSTPAMTLTTTMVPHEQLGMIPQSALTEIPLPTDTQAPPTDPVVDPEQQVDLEVSFGRQGFFDMDRVDPAAEIQASVAEVSGTTSDIPVSLGIPPPYAQDISHMRFDFDASLSDSERIAALERVVAEQSRINLIQTHAIQRLVAENQLQSSLLVEHGKLFDALKEFLASQGEPSCKGDELRTKKRQDRDDDPNASKGAGGELPRTEQTLGTSTSQGESTGTSGGSGGENVVVVDDEEVLGDDDDLTDDVLTIDEIEKIGEQIVIDSEIEEGEIVDDSVEHDIPDVDRVNVSQDVDVSDESEWEEQPRWKEGCAQWFFKTKKPAVPTMFKKSYNIKGYAESKKGIICWLYDKQLKLFVIKRYDGIQYFKKALRSLNTLPECEVKDLAKLGLINRSGDNMARIIGKIVWKESVKEKKFELLKPQKGKLVEDKERGTRADGKPWLVMKYKPIRCLKEVPMKMMPKNVLKNLKWWYVDCQTAEAVMEDEDEQEILRVYDPMHLVNFLKLTCREFMLEDEWHEIFGITRHEKEDRDMKLLPRGSLLVHDVSSSISCVLHVSVIVLDCLFFF
ncbi:uncharacterized protein LOC143557729 [Bidens hawaiensis]|uniref:uncharacterized protein LOC143557729 n=1 Tax=Bidens hawaiensis TaxID=980011 RepID=UPI00404B10E0